MANLSGTGNIRHVGHYLTSVQVELYAGAKIYEGAMVCRRIADGYAVRAGTASTGRVQGIAQSTTATCVASGDTNVNLLTGVFVLNVHGSTPPVLADIGKTVYASDDQTVSKVPSDGPVAGTLVGIEDSTGRAFVLVGPEPSAETGFAYVEIPVYPSILAAGTPMAAFADNAASAPGVTLVDSKAMGIRWNNAASQVAVWTRFLLPNDIDTNFDAVLELYASKTGATVGDATTFTVAAFNNALGALHDADTDFGGATSAMTGNATAKTVQKVTRTLALADLGVAGEPVSLSFKPTDGTLGTDDVVLEGMRLKYRRKPA